MIGTPRAIVFHIAVADHFIFISEVFFYKIRMDRLKFKCFVKLFISETYENKLI